ncbi:carbohydrate-binding protein [Streptomyces meridianus]|uniref:Carbohydrate-binding protein n=1 Tax=Streptomyces meridianus TaxID=2938945 RepID=A0ABT0X3X9_9ACTN|nr:carbohydrate-binding protein [Streptomyces meridianus]MCM2577251.1 carbohydrate-binding protein [Streptomyces meridianus]
MTAGNNGASPENDDPFGYLYRSEGGDGGAEANTGAAPRAGGYGYPGTAPQPGVPRTSYNQVKRVGERQYGQQAQQPQGYGGSGYDRTSPNPHYAAPETLPGGAPSEGVNPGGRAAVRQASRGPNNKGLLIGAIAVVGAVVIGIGVAMASNGNDDGREPGKDDAAAAVADSGDGGRDQEGSRERKRPDKPFATGKKDAVGLRLDGGATPARDVPNATSGSGAYVGGMQQPGATASWSVDVPKKGLYTLFVGYGVPGQDANATLVVNGKPRTEPLPLKNYANAKPGEWDKGWTRTFAWIELNEGTNAIQVSCAQGNQCNFNLDWVRLKSGQVKK